MRLSNERNGIKFFCSIDEIIDANIKFDFVFCTHVIEHIYDLHQFIKKMDLVLGEKALCYIEVPNAAAYITGHKAPFYYFDREHINHFTPVSLKNLFLLHGFEDIWHEYSNNIAMIFQKSTPTNIAELSYDHTYAQNILAYIEQSRVLDAGISYDNLTPPIILWGFGAYLRRIFLKPDFPEAIAAIIDRDRGGKGRMWNGIPLVTADILAKKEFSRATVLITSVLYAEEITCRITQSGFQGTVLTAF